MNDVDLDLIIKSKMGDEESQEKILKKYKNLVKSISNKYNIAGADKDDILQEGMIGLYKAIRDFDVNGKVYFNIFAKKCISNQILTAVRNSNRKKNIPLNDYLSFEVLLEEDKAKYFGTSEHYPFE